MLFIPLLPISKNAEVMTVEFIFVLIVVVVERRVAVQSASDLCTGAATENA